MVRTQQFTCPGDSDIAEIEALLGGELAPETLSFTRSVLDTIDRRLAHRHLILLCDRSPQRAVLVLREGDGHQLAAASHSGECPRRLEDIGDRRLRRLLAPLIGARILLASHSWPVEARHLEYRDEEGKSVGTVAIERQQDGLTLCAVPRRGYQREFARYIKPWSSSAPFVRRHRDVALVLLDQFVDKPLREMPAARGNYAAHTPARTVMADLIRAARERMVSNEPGVMADLDSEFLHEFRIAMRSGRSLIGVCSPFGGVTHALGKQFRWISRLSGELRDLDVWRAELAGSARADEHLDAFVGAMRARCHPRLVRALRSRRYARFHAEWVGWIEQLYGNADTAAALRFDEFAAKMLRRQYRKLRDLARPHHDSITALELHEVRKQTKKLRYLIESCACIYPAERTAPLLDKLKGLQNSAGKRCDRYARMVLIDAWLAKQLDSEVATALREAREQIALPERLKLNRRQHHKLGERLHALTSRATRAQFRELGL